MNQARQAVEENRKRLNKVEVDQEIIIAAYDKYRWLKIIVGVVITYRVDPIGAACVSQLITAAPPMV